MNAEEPIPGIEAEGNVRDNAPLVISARVQELLSWEPFLKDPRRVEELHRMRIAAKRLRYTVEVFEPFLGKPGTELLDRLKRVQDLLGEIHDLDVMVPALATEARKALKMATKLEAWLEADLNGVLGLCSLCRNMQHRRHVLYSTLKQEWRRLRKDGLLELVSSPLSSDQPAGT